MEIKKLISDQCQDPDTLSWVNRAFDEIWESIAEGFSHDPSAAAVVRERLARIILNGPANALLDTAHVKTVALQLLALAFPHYSDRILRRPPARAASEPL